MLRYCLNVFTNLFFSRFLIWVVFSRVIIKIEIKQKIFFQLGFTPCKAEQPLQGMKLQEKEAQKD